MRETSLVYIVKDEKVLMLHRIRKKNDENHGKWIGVGGKFEQERGAGGNRTSYRPVSLLWNRDIPER